MSMLENPTPFEEWMFQNAEGVETFPRDKMLEKAFNDGKKIGEDKISQHILELQADKGRLTDELNICQELLGKEKIKNVEQSLELTEAKEIIKTFCGLCDVFNSSNGSFDNLIARAEAFLKE